MTALTALAVAGETRLVPLMTCDTVETETPASRATSAIVVTSPPEPSATAPCGGSRLLLERQGSISKRLRNRFDGARGVDRSGAPRNPNVAEPGRQGRRLGGLKNGLGTSGPRIAKMPSDGSPRMHELCIQA
jgi:hypothetical protein